MDKEKKYDFMTIGSATIDYFIESDQSIIASYSTIKAQNELMCFPYGAKIEIDDFSRNIGGGGLNTAINFSQLGFTVASMAKMGKRDEIQGLIKKHLKKFKVNTETIIQSESHMTGFSVILVSFQGDRTVLAHRGANGHIESKDIDYEAIKNSKWLYVAPLSGKSNRVLDTLATYAKENNVNLAINAGTTAIKKGHQYFSNIIKAAKILVLNKDEAQLLTKINVRPDTKTKKYSKEAIHPDIIAMHKKLRTNSKAIIVITDGKNGVSAYDGKNIYKCGEFPATVVSTLGAGDCFASTFTATIEKFGKNIEKALEYASVNAASIVEHFGAQEGFLSFEEIQKRLDSNPDFKAEKIVLE
ncbi:MAG: carbohydrate kinase family protein [Cyanobacteria bacterium SIG30]|nr:carbohydrate kinase family protein [Cyanobacteria bacterium SIG30]